MKRLILLLIISSINLIAQDDKSLEYYYAANEAVSKKQYELADSLYTLSLNMKPTADTYYNRAIVKKQLNKMTEYCADIGSASSLNDKESTDLFWKDCCSKDSIFYNKNGLISDNKNYSYYEVISKMKYSSDNTYRKYNKANTKLISYSVKEGDTIFFLTQTPPVYPEDEENIKLVLMNNVLLNQEDIKDLKYWWAVVRYTVSKNGENENIKCSSNLGKNYNEQVEAIFKKYIKKWKPAEYNGKKVKYSMELAFTPLVKKK